MKLFLLFLIRRLGIWLFMSEMPFGTLSVQMLWKLFYLMHQVESGNLDKLSTALLPAECKKHLQGTAVPASASLSHVPLLFMALFFLFLGVGDV